MNLADMGIVSIPVITIIAYLVGSIFKSFIGTDAINKYIPVIVMVAGLILGIAAYYAAPELMAANDVFTAAAIGIVSGGAATAVNQVIKQLGGSTTTKSE